MGPIKQLMAIFVYFVFPLADARCFHKSANTLPYTDFKNLKPEQDFIRSFGIATYRKMPADSKWKGENIYVKAVHAISLSPNFNKQKLGGQFFPISSHKRLFSDGKVTRLEIVFKIKKFNQNRIISPHDIQSAFYDLMNAQVTIPTKEQNTFKLCNLGRMLAKQYLISTTDNTKEINIENWWVSYGKPMIFLELDQGIQFGDLKGINKKEHIYIEGIKLSYFRFFKDEPISIWVLEQNIKYDISKDIIRNHRIHFLRAHSEWAGLRNILMLNEKHKIKESKKLNEYILDAGKLILSKKFDGISQSEIIKEIKEKVIEEDYYYDIMINSMIEDDEANQEISELIESDESDTVEFKSTGRWCFKEKQKSKDVEHGIVKTVAAFLNSKGGTLLIGVSDKGNIVGLNYDYKSFRDKKNRDGFELWFYDLIFRKISKDLKRYIDVYFYSKYGTDICIVKVKSASNPVFVKKIPKENVNETFYIRTGNSTNELNIHEIANYCIDWKVRKEKETENIEKEEGYI
jgi:hypothetical protein